MVSFFWVGICRPAFFFWFCSVQTVQILSGRYLTTLSNGGEQKSNILDEINRKHVNS